MAEFSMASVADLTDSVRFTQVKMGKHCNQKEGSFHTRYEDIGGRSEKCLIVLDDELLGDLTIAAARALVIANEIAPLRIVAVGFGEEEIGALTQQRARFLTFQQGSLELLGLNETGGGEVLLDYLGQHVLPLCASSSSLPALLGYSLSANFALHAAGRRRDNFGAVGAISPSLWSEPRAAKEIAQALADQEELRLYLAAGTGETDAGQTGEVLHMFEKVDALGAELQHRFGDRVSTRLYADETHFSVPFASICDMLRKLPR